MKERERASIYCRYEDSPLPPKVIDGGTGIMLELQTALLAAYVAGIVASPVAVARGRTIWGRTRPRSQGSGVNWADYHSHGHSWPRGVFLVRLM